MHRMINDPNAVEGFYPIELKDVPVYRPRFFYNDMELFDEDTISTRVLDLKTQKVILHVTDAMVPWIRPAVQDN